MPAQERRRETESAETWLGWDRSALATLFSGDPNPYQLGEAISRLLAARLDDPSAGWSFELYLWADGQDRYQLAGEWGAPGTPRGTAPASLSTAEADRLLESLREDGQGLGLLLDHGAQVLGFG